MPSLPALPDDAVHMLLHRAAHVGLPATPTLTAADKRMHALWQQDAHAKERLQVAMQTVHRDLRARLYQWDPQDWPMHPEDLGCETLEQWQAYLALCAQDTAEEEEPKAVEELSITYKLKRTGVFDDRPGLGIFNLDGVVFADDD
jgi:hypothetical protein